MSVRRGDNYALDPAKQRGSGREVSSVDKADIMALLKQHPLGQLLVSGWQSVAAFAPVFDVARERLEKRGGACCVRR
jgi:hypothetical protein